MGFVLAPLMRSVRFTNPAGSWGVWATPWQNGVQVSNIAGAKNGWQHRAAKLRKCVLLETDIYKPSVQPDAALWEGRKERLIVRFSLCFSLEDTFSDAVAQISLRSLLSLFLSSFAPFLYNCGFPTERLGKKAPRETPRQRRFRVSSLSSSAVTCGWRNGVRDRYETASIYLGTPRSR